jgi:hypothetical protein
VALTITALAGSPVSLPAVTVPSVSTQASAGAAGDQDRHAVMLRGALAQSLGNADLAFEKFATSKRSTKNEIVEKANISARR